MIQARVLALRLMQMITWKWTLVPCRVRKLVVNGWIPGAEAVVLNKPAGVVGPFLRLLENAEGELILALDPGQLAVIRLQLQATRLRMVASPADVHPASDPVHLGVMRL